MFRRRKSAQPDDEYYEEEFFPDDDPAEAGPVGRPAGDPRPGGGPWDIGEPYPDRDRVDLGSLHIPVDPAHEVQLFMAQEHGAWVTIRHGGSELQVQAFAAPRSGMLWDEIRPEIAAEVGQAGGVSSESMGTFGAALDAEVPAEPGNPASGMRQVRFIGVDGPRWFIRGLISGPAVESGQADEIEAIFRDIVVVRGEYPVPPRDLLELRLPPDAQQAMEEQLAAQEQNPYAELDPFERGPEITETR